MRITILRDLALKAEISRSRFVSFSKQSVRPDDHQTIYIEALVLTQLGRGDEARKAYQRALEFTTKYLDLQPDDARSYVLGAGALARLRETERAKEWADRAMSLAPDDDAILYNAGCAFAVVGDKQRALDALERAIGAGLEGGLDPARP
jgi:adenylate cyclase